MACNKVRTVDKVGALDGSLAEAQVADGQTAGLLGVVCKVALCEHVGVVADDLDAVLVCTDGTIGTKAEELAADRALGSGVHKVALGEGSIHNIVDDADGEMVLGFVELKVVVNLLDHGGGEFLAAEAVSAAVALDVKPCLRNRVNDVEVERFAEGAGFLGSVKNSDLLAGCGDSRKELVRCEGTIQANLDKAELLALCVEVVDSFFRNIRAAAHDNENALCIGCADVIEQVVSPAGQIADFFHVVFNDLGNLCIVDVCSFTALEIDVGILRGTGLMGMLGVECTLTETLNGIVIEQLCHILVFDLFDLLNLMRGAEAVEEMNERQARLDCGKMGHECKIHNFLYGSGSEHCKTRLTCAHNVTVIAENGKRMSCECACRNMENAGKHFAGDFVHVGDHQKKTLRSGECGCQCACRKGTVNCACCAALGLHFRNADLLTEKILPALCAPFIGNFCHGRGRSDGVNSRNIGKCVCDMRRSGIAIDSDGLCHRDFILLENLLALRTAAARKMQPCI